MHTIIQGRIAHAIRTQLDNALADHHTSARDYIRLRARVYKIARSIAAAYRREDSRFKTDEFMVACGLRSQYLTDDKPPDTIRIPPKNRQKTAKIPARTTPGQPPKNPKKSGNFSGGNLWA